MYGKPSDLFLDEGCFENTCQNLFLVYSEQGILVVVESKDLSLNVQVSPTLPVRNVAFFEPYNLKDSLSKIAHAGACNLLP
jgi:hypothetical protein